jgi:hypothetical protein
MVIQGWELHAGDIGLIRSLPTEHGDWRRPQYQREALPAPGPAQWTGPIRQFKDMAARTLLLKLERAGLIQLQKRRRRCSASSHANFHRLKAEVETENAALRDEAAAEDLRRLP